MGALRLLLALVVVGSHTPVGVPGMLDAFTAVRIFFLISGFYMFLILDGTYADARSFWLNRFLKLWPMYAVVCFFTFWVWILWEPKLVYGFLSFGPWVKSWIVAVQPLLVGHDWLLFTNTPDGHHVALTANYNLDIRQLKTYALVPQAWTLALEIYFYLLAPWLVRLSTRSILGVVAGVYALRWFVMFGLGFDFEPWPSHVFPFELATFLLGGLAYRAYRTGLFARLARDNVFNGLCAVAVAGVLFGGNHLGASHAELLRSVYLGVMFVGVPWLFHLTRAAKWDRALGDLSYPLYVSHMIPILIIDGWMLWPADKTMQTLAAFAAAIALAVALEFTVARPLERLRRIVRAKGA